MELNAQSKIVRKPNQKTFLKRSQADEEDYDVDRFLMVLTLSHLCIGCKSFTCPFIDKICIIPLSDKAQKRSSKFFV